MAALAAELVAIDGEPAGEEYYRLAPISRKTVRQCGLNASAWRLGFEKRLRGQPRCLLQLDVGGTRSLLFHGHSDVVPAQSIRQFQPFP